MSIQKIMLESAERPLRIERLLVQRTYIGVVEGRPHAEDNVRCIEHFTSWVRKITGFDAPHVFTPTVDESKGYPRLPEYACAIELTSFEPAVDMSTHMSYVVVIWFQAQNPLAGS